jgi:hypothetical protein
MRLGTILLGILGLVGQAQSATIELRNPNTPAGCLTWDHATPSFLVVLHPDGATNIIGAFFRISGLPPGCNVTVMPSSSAVIAQGALFSPWAEIRFAAPLTEPDVLLYEVTLSRPDPLPPGWGFVTLRPAAVESVFQEPWCPAVLLSGQAGPNWTCAEYTSISDLPEACEVAVVPKTWTSTKLLYH